MEQWCVQVSQLRAEVVLILSFLASDHTSSVINSVETGAYEAGKWKCADNADIIVPLIEQVLCS
jgi:hypothetical protein